MRLGGLTSMTHLIQVAVCWFCRPPNVGISVTCLPLSSVKGACQWPTDGGELQTSSANTTFEWKWWMAISTGNITKETRERHSPPQNVIPGRRLFVSGSTSYCKPVVRRLWLSLPLSTFIFGKYAMKEESSKSCSTGVTANATFISKTKCQMLAGRAHWDPLCH